MNITINQLDREAATGIITTIHWSASKTAGDTVIPYANVTQANVLAWLGGAMDLVATEAGLDTQLANLAAPAVLNGLPWVSA